MRIVLMDFQHNVGDTMVHTVNPPLEGAISRMTGYNTSYAPSSASSSPLHVVVFSSRHFSLPTSLLTGMTAKLENGNSEVRVKEQG